MSRYSTPRVVQSTFEVEPEETDVQIWKNFNCDQHPNFKIDAIAVNDNRSDVRLFCLKCMINGDNYKVQEGDKLIALTELIQKCTDTTHSASEKVSKSREDMQNQCLSFLTRDYGSIYQRNAERQLRNLDQEITDLVEKLAILRGKYQEFYAKGSEEIKVHIKEIKQKMGNILDDDTSFEQVNKTSHQEVQERLSKVQTKFDLSETAKWLYTKSKENSEFTTGDQKKLIESMDKIKGKVLESEDLYIDVSQFKGMQVVFSLINQNSILLQAIFYIRIFKSNLERKISISKNMKKKTKRIMISSSRNQFKCKGLERMYPKSVMMIESCLKALKTVKLRK